MVFAFSTDDKTLMVFASEAEAISYAEGIDVEDGVWLFFDGCGCPLAATFTAPNKRGSFVAVSGDYHLEPGQGQNLSDLLPEVASVEGVAQLNTVADVKVLLASNLAVKRDAPQAARPLP